jgi:hypothetical protein
MVFKTVLLAVYLRHLDLDQSWYKTISDKIKSGLMTASVTSSKFWRAQRDTDRIIVKHFFLIILINLLSSIHFKFYL